MDTQQNYSFADAMAYCLQQPGVTSASFVDIKTGIPISTVGESSLPTECLLPFLTEWFLSTHGSDIVASAEGCSPVCTQPDDYQNSIGEIKVMLGNDAHLIYPLTARGRGLYIYLALGHGKKIMPSIRRCLSNINAML